jgi:hypothetical protein
MLSLAAISVALSPHPKIPFLADKAPATDVPACRTGARPRRFDGGAVLELALWLRVQPKRFELPTPFGRSIAQTRDVDASRQAAFDRGADQLRSKKRDRHVDMTDAASLGDGGASGRALANMSGLIYRRYLELSVPCGGPGPLALGRRLTYVNFCSPTALLRDRRWSDLPNLGAANEH